jgi:hypothetical protein
MCLYQLLLVRVVQVGLIHLVQTAKTPALRPWSVLVVVVVVLGGLRLPDFLAALVVVVALHLVHNRVETAQPVKAMMVAHLLVLVGWLESVVAVVAVEQVVQAVMRLRLSLVTVVLDLHRLSQALL